MKKHALVAALTLAACSPAPEATNKTVTKDSPSVAAYQAANDKMHKDMGVALTGNADVDFMRSMIPHHEGAVAMAKVALEHGKDQEVRKLAEDVIAAQETEIVRMKTWLAKNGKQTAAKAAGTHDNH